MRRLKLATTAAALLLSCSVARAWIHGTGLSPNMFNVRNYGAKGDCATDDSGAIASAAALAVTNTSNGQPSAVYFPAGCYVYKTGLATWTVPVSVVGDGHLKSIIKLDPSFAGDAFSWSEVWYLGTIPNGGNTIALSGQKSSVIVQGVSVVGQRSAASQQNAFVFYDRADGVLFDDVETWYLRGRALYTGALKSQINGFMRESTFRDLRFFNSGDTNVPVVEFSSTGTGDATDEINISNLNIYANYGPGLALRGNRTGAAVYDLKFYALRIEGLENGAIAAPLFQIGDPTLTGGVNRIFCEMCELIDPYTSQPALWLTAPSAAAQPYEIHFTGNIGGGLANGRGIQVDAGRYLYFHLNGMVSTGTNVTIGSSSTVSSPLLFDGEALESTWTWSIDPTSVNFVSTPMWRQGNPSANGTLQASGTGAPAVAAPVGSTFQRTDGGASTSLYVKESGTGTSGWVGK